MDKKNIKVDFQEYALFTLLSDRTWSIFYDKELEPHFKAILSILEKRISLYPGNDYDLTDIYVVKEYVKD